jgi:hypothetical protein
MVYPLRAMSEPNFAARNQIDVLVRERKDILTRPWLGATVLIGVYAGVLTYFGGATAAPLPPMVGPAMMTGAAVLGLLSVVVPRLQLSDKKLQARLREPVEAYRWAKTMHLRGPLMDQFKALPSDEQRLLGLTIPFQRPYLIGLGLANGVATIGLVYGFMNKTLMEAAPFLLAALALTAWHYPRLGPLIDRGRKLDRHEEEDEAIELVERLEKKKARASQSQPPPAAAAAPARKAVSRLASQPLKPPKSDPPPAARKSVARATSQPLKPSASEPPPPRRPSREQGPAKR